MVILKKGIDKLQNENNTLKNDLQVFKNDKETLTRPVVMQFINDLKYYSHPYGDELNYISEYFVYTAFDNENILELLNNKQYNTYLKFDLGNTYINTIQLKFKLTNNNPIHILLK